MRIQIVI